MNDKKARRDIAYRPSPAFKDKLTMAETAGVGLACFFAAMICAVIQTGFFLSFRPFGCAPDLCMALSLAVGLKFGPKCGGIVGLISGFFVDSLAAVGFSLAIPFYLSLGILIGILAEPESGVNLPPFPLFLLGLVCGSGAISAASLINILMNYSMPGPAQLFLGSLLPQFLSDLVFGPAVYPPVALTLRLLQKKQRFVK